MILGVLFGGLILLVTLSVLVFLAYTCFARIVPAKRKVVLRHAFTQRKREIGPGLRLQWPWESAVTAFLPIGDRVIEISDFDIYYRYDPRPYVVGTLDKVEAYVDVRIDYAISNLDHVTDATGVNLRMLIDDAVREEVGRLVGSTLYKDLNASGLTAGLGQLKWPTRAGIQVQQVGVQGIAFDPAVQAISRSVSMGVPIETALRHVEQLSFVEALRQNKNAHVILDQATMGGGDRGMLNLAMRGAARRTELARVNPYPPAEMRAMGETSY